jgi:hypothetical protein
MTRHDAAMTRLAQWWRRTLRGGYAFAQGAALHGRSAERHWVREARSAWLWGAIIPLGIVLLALAIGPIALAGVLVYPLQMLRIYRRDVGGGEVRAARAFFLVLAKFAEAAGQAQYLLHRRFGGGGRLIEYK